MEIFHYLYPKEPRVILDIDTPNLRSRLIVMELYCANPDCKCNDGLFQVIQRNFFGLPKRAVTLIRYSWEKPLSPTNPRINYDKDDPEKFDENESQVCLDAFKKKLIEEEGLINRLKKHYQMVKNFGQDKNPDLVKPVTRQRSNIGRNDLCPCVSGKKYKKCCLLNR